MSHEAVQNNFYAWQWHENWKSARLGLDKNKIRAAIFSNDYDW